MFECLGPSGRSQGPPLLSQSPFPPSTLALAVHQIPTLFNPPVTRLPTAQSPQYPKPSSSDSSIKKSKHSQNAIRKRSPPRCLLPRSSPGAIQDRIHHPAFRCPGRRAYHTEMGWWSKRCKPSAAVTQSRLQITDIRSNPSRSPSRTASRPTSNTSPPSQVFHPIPFQCQSRIVLTVNQAKQPAAPIPGRPRNPSRTANTPSKSPKASTMSTTAACSPSAVAPPPSPQPPFLSLRRRRLLLPPPPLP